MKDLRTEFKAKINCSFKYTYTNSNWTVNCPKYLLNFLIKIYRQALRYQMNDKIISLEIKLEEKRHEIELQKIEYLKLEEEIQNQKRLDDLYKQKKALLLDTFV